MFLGVDLGTGSVKALLLAADGSVVRTESVEYAVRSPLRGRAESDPQRWWAATARAVRAVVRESGAGVEAVGLSGQMHGFVLSGPTGEPLRPAILWADARAARCLGAYRRLDAEIRRRLANPPAVGMAGPTLMWLREEEPGLYRTARWALQPKDWLRLRMTGEVATEPSDASATLLYDLESDGWYAGAVSALGLDNDLLAPVRSSTDVAGTLTESAAEALGLQAGTPVAVGAADTAAALIGTGLQGSGTFQLTVGTGAQIVTLRDDFSPDPTNRTHLFRTALPTEAPYYAMAAMQNAGLALEWVRRTLGVSWPQFYDEAFAEGVRPGAGGVTFVAHLGGERTPGFRPEARGAWSNLGLEHERGHLLRAALEGVAFSIRDGLEALEAAAEETPHRLRLAGGGTTDPRWRTMLADVLGRHLALLPEFVSANASALGAAIVAGVACGGLAAPPFLAKPERFISPDADAPYEEAYSAYIARRTGGS
ncbi:xylulokinase [Rubrobacter indicoceani]|uniref:xylulokinase n=1 Tax=Rubrobacter indicoceani TaxID=2051957 RepID=UPI000E5B702F|nr:FGGY family carbohydrate kinase [Rubrobacter indicoceani]